MKSIVVLLCLVLFSSCVVQETLTFNENNSGKLMYRIDMSKMMEMAGDKLAPSNNDSKSSKKKNKKSKQEEKVPQLVDSIFSFKQIYAEKQDSISKLPMEEQLRLKKMERYSGRIIMDEANKKMEFQFFTDFQNPSELLELVSPVNSLSGMNASSAQLGKETPKNNGLTSYIFDGNKFSKKVKVSFTEELNKEITQIKEEKGKNEGDSEEENIDVEELAAKMSDTFKMLYNESSYEMTVNFHKKIKSVSMPNAKISADRKSVTLVFPMENYMESKDIDFEIELE